jgi:hypothetical protein
MPVSKHENFKLGHYLKSGFDGSLVLPVFHNQKVRVYHGRGQSPKPAFQLISCFASSFFTSPST